MTAAAKSLFLTQGAVTQQVRNLERALGLRLVERTGGRIRLTSAGTAVADACRVALRSVEEVDRTARNLASLEAGSLRIGASPTAAAHYLPVILQRFSRQHGSVAVTVITENTPHVAAAVAAGGLDCGFVEGPIEQHGLLETSIATDSLIVVVGADHPLARLDAPDPDALEAHVYLGREPGAALELYAEQMLGPGLHRGRRMQFGHLDAVRGAVVAGLGYAVLPRVAIADELEQGLLAALPWSPLVRPITAIRRPPAGAGALEALWTMLTESTTVLGSGVA
jgi:DNA-binding transcriptional LysR family regulator